jgi:hypothetical protein
MATQTMTVNPQKITVPANTNDNDLNIDAFISNQGTILIENISGPIRFNNEGTTDGTISGVYTTTDKLILDAQKGQTLHFRGAAGSETFQITVLNQ